MILKGSQRTGAMELAAHLLKGAENEHIALHEMRGFMANTALGAFKEMEAVARGTRCKQFMFSLSLNPPADADVSVAAFEEALERVETRLCLGGQPRLVVFHEKNGRRHAHCVWSRINPETMTAINLPHYKLKLCSIAKSLFAEHGWKMPQGFIHHSRRDPTNFSLAEWQQAKRHDDDPKALKTLFQNCWAISDSGKAFARALEDRGFYLARGDRRGFVAVDYRGEVYSLSRWIGVKPKELKAKLGPPENLPDIEKAKASIGRAMTQVLESHIHAADRKRWREAMPLLKERRAMTRGHQETRQELGKKQEARQRDETAARIQRVPRGIKIIWSFVTGKYARIRKLNELETIQAARRDRSEAQALIQAQLQERRSLQERLAALRGKQTKERESLRIQIAQYLRLGRASTFLERETPENSREGLYFAPGPETPEHTR